MMTASAQSNRDRHLAKGWRLGAGPSYLDKHGGGRQVAVQQTHLAACEFSDAHRSNPKLEMSSAGAGLIKSIVAVIRIPQPKTPNRVLASLSDEIPGADGRHPETILKGRN
jgi:hypothetical protein